ncbi:MAG: 30S ribosomal protein S24e [Methanomassiliicoccales archaeon]
MNLEIDRKKENPLMERLEVDFTLDHVGEATPNRQSVKDQLASALNVEKERIVLDHVRSDFGRQISSGYAKVYDSVESAKRLERDYLLVREGLAESK